jgi:hypothetical protein
MAAADRNLPRSKECSDIESVEVLMDKRDNWPSLRCIADEADALDTAKLSTGVLSEVLL